MAKNIKINKLSKYGFVGLIGLLGIPFIGLSLVFGILGVQSDGHDINRVFETGRLFSNVSISTHMIFGAALTALAPLQLLLGWSRKWMKAHRIIGYCFTVAAVLTSFGGFTYVLIHGTTGGQPMNIAFSVYGALLLLATYQTIQQVRNKNILKHNEWALRLFILAMGSWFYRVCYGVYFTIDPSGSGHSNDFHGLFDLIMNFGFFLPPLLMLEGYFYLNRKGMFKVHPFVSILTTLFVSMLLIIGTWWFFNLILSELMK